MGREKQLIHAAFSFSAHSFCAPSLSSSPASTLRSSLHSPLPPQLLLLDEYVNNLDSSLEHEITEQLEELCRGRTSITVAHRLGTAQTADRVLVLALRACLLTVFAPLCPALLCPFAALLDVLAAGAVFGIPAGRVAIPASTTPSMWIPS